MTQVNYLALNLCNLRNLWIALILLVLAPMASSAAPSDGVINVSLSSSRPKPGETVEIRVQTSKNDPVYAVLLTPFVGSRSLSLVPVPAQRGGYRSTVVLPAAPPQGMYVVHVWTGGPANPTSVGRGTFLVGRLINDFF